MATANGAPAAMEVDAKQEQQQQQQHAAPEPAAADLRILAVFCNPEEEDPGYDPPGPESTPTFASSREGCKVRSLRALLGFRKKRSVAPALRCIVAPRRAAVLRGCAAVHVETLPSLLQRVCVWRSAAA